MSRRSEIIRLVIMSIATVWIAVSGVYAVIGDDVESIKFGVYACTMLLFAALVKLEWL